MKCKKVRNFPSKSVSNEAGIVSVEYILATVLIVIVSLTAISQLQAKTEESYRDSVTAKPFYHQSKALLVSSQ